MRKKLIVLFTLVFVSLSFATFTFAAGKTTKEPNQTTCPVMAGKIDKTIYADYKGKRVYFCCSGCQDEFKKDPDKYIKAMEKEGITLEKTP
jgi:YHS domain-containing protein